MTPVGHCFVEKPTALAHRRGVHSLRGLPPQYACSSAPNLSPPAAHKCTTCPGGKHHVGPFADTSRRQCEGGQRKEEAKGEKEKRRRIGQRCRAPVRSRDASAASGARCHLQRQGGEGHADTVSSEVTVAEVYSMNDPSTSSMDSVFHVFDEFHVFNVFF